MLLYWLVKSVPISLTSTSRSSILLVFLVLYLIAVRLGPFLILSVSSVALQSVPQDLEVQSRVLSAFIKSTTRPPSLFVSSSRRYSSLTLIMGNKNSTKKQKHVEPPPPVADEGVTTDEALVEEQLAEIEQLPEYPLDPEGRVRKKKMSLDSTLHDMEKVKEMDRRGSTLSAPETKGVPDTEVTVKFSDIEDSLETGDIALLYRAGQTLPNFGIFVNHANCDPYFPLLMIKGKTKPLELSQFNAIHRDVRIITAVTRIFYGDYDRVAIRRLRTGQKFDCLQALKVAEKVEAEIKYSSQEVMMITEAETPEQRSLIMCTFTLAHVYKELGVLLANPIDLRPDTFLNALPLSDPIFIKLPPVKLGPLVTGTPPLLSQIADGIRPPPDFPTKTYGQIRDELQTGDIVLFSGATSSGALIKIFDGAIFSHVGLVLRPRYSSYVMVWESSTNKAGLVDVDTGTVRRGVELLPLRNKIFSGWYDRVAIRRLTGLTDKQRETLYETMLKVRKNLQGRPYEKNQLDLIMSAVDFDDKYLDFLRSHEEDLSSIFCSELVAHVYQELDLIDKTRLSSEYTPDSFASHRALKLNYGKLEPEVYVDVRLDFEKDVFRQSSISAAEANKIVQ